MAIPRVTSDERQQVGQFETAPATWLRRALNRIRGLSLPWKGKSTTVPSGHQSTSKDPYTYANDVARTVFETTNKVTSLLKNRPPEDSNLDLQLISFHEDDRRKGLAAIFATGTVVFTGRENVLLVPARTLQILDKLHIRYYPVPISDSPEDAPTTHTGSAADGASFRRFTSDVA